MSKKDNHGLAILILVLAVGSVGILQLTNFSITGYATEDKCLVQKDPLQVLCKDLDGDGTIYFPIAAKAYKSAGLDPKEARGMQSMGGGQYTSGKYELEDYDYEEEYDEYSMPEPEERVEEGISEAEEEIFEECVPEEEDESSEYKCVPWSEEGFAYEEYEA